MSNPARRDQDARQDATEQPLASGMPIESSRKAHTPDEKREAIDRLLEHIRTLPKHEGECAARSQDFLYDEDGLPG